MPTDPYQNLGPGALTSNDSPFRISRANWLRLQLGVAQFDGPFPGGGEADQIHLIAGQLYREWRDVWSPRLVTRAQAVRAFGELVLANYPVLIDTVNRLDDDAAVKQLNAALRALHDQATQEQSIEQDLAVGFSGFADRCEALRIRVTTFVQQQADQDPWFPPEGLPLEEDLKSTLLGFALLRGIWFALASDLQQLSTDTVHLRTRYPLADLLVLQLKQALLDWQTVMTESAEFAQNADQPLQLPAVHFRSELCGRALLANAWVVGIGQREPDVNHGTWRRVPYNGAFLLVTGYGQCLETMSSGPSEELLSDDGVELALRPFSGDPKQLWTFQAGANGCQRIVSGTSDSHIGGRCVAVKVNDGQTLRDVQDSLSNDDVTQVYLFPTSTWRPTAENSDNPNDDRSVPPGVQQLWRVG